MEMEHMMVTQPAGVEPTQPRSPSMTELLTQAATAFMSPLPAAPPPQEENVNCDSAPAPAFPTACHTTTPAYCHRCKCKKSRCMKLYCECFAAKEFCTGCQCVNCLNTVDNAVNVYKARRAIEARNPQAFQAKIQTTTSPVGSSSSSEGAEDGEPAAAAVRHVKGCHCKRSNCRKKYCECYQAGVACTDACKCDGCKNGGGGGNHRCSKPAAAVAVDAYASDLLGVSLHATPSDATTAHELSADVCPNKAMAATDLSSTPAPPASMVKMEATCAPPSLSPFQQVVHRLTVNRVKMDPHTAPPPPPPAASLPPPATTTTTTTTDGGKRRTASPCRRCSCKKSKCLKLYCECFMAQVYCNGCLCTDCHNTPDHEEKVQEARAHIQSRDPNAFLPKVRSGGTAHKKGCHCKRSNCQKKYCECYQAGVACTDACKCDGCKNGGGGGNHGCRRPAARAAVPASDARAAETAGTATPTRGTDGGGSNGIGSSALTSPTDGRLPSPCGFCMANKKASCGSDFAHFNCQLRTSPPVSKPAVGSTPVAATPTLPLAVAADVPPPVFCTPTNAMVAGPAKPATASGGGGGSGSFMSPPPRSRRMSGAACSPSPAHGLNVLAAMSSELGPRLATPLSKDSEAVCENTAYHGVTFHQKKQKYLSRLSLPDGQYANLGFHEDGELAAAAYDCAAYVAKGHGATLNFRDEEGGPARNGDVPSPTSQPGGLIGRRVECRDEDGDWTPGVIIGYMETTVAYTILHADGTEESVVLPHVAVRVLDKDSSAEAAAHTLLESLASAQAEGGDVETPEAAGGRRRKCSPLALATQVRSVANRLPASAVIEQRTKVWTKFDQSLACATSVAEVASQLMYLHANTRVLLPSWARSQRPRWLADMQRLQEEVSKPAIDDEGPILRPGRRLKGLIQGLEGGMDWELVEQLWEAEDVGGVKHAQQLLEDSSGKDGNVTSPAGVAGGGRDDGVKRKRNAPRGSHHSGGGGAAAPADEEETVDTQRRKALRPQATGPIKSQHADGSEGRARTSRFCLQWWESTWFLSHMTTSRSCFSLYRGVSWHKERSQWLARLYQKGGKYVHLGYHASEESAAKAYDAAVQRILGPDGILNFGQGGQGGGSRRTQQAHSATQMKTAISRSAALREPFAVLSV